MIDRRRNLAHGKKFLQIRDGNVAHSDRLAFPLRHEPFHGFPGIEVAPPLFIQKATISIGEQRDAFGGRQRDRPMHQVLYFC